MSLFVINIFNIFNKILLILPAHRPPVDDPAELRLTTATGPGGVRGPGVA